MLFGGSSGKPMRYISPPAACATRSDDFQAARGPLAPNPDMRAWMMRGLMLRSASVSSSADAAELSSTSTSAEAMRRSNVSRPSALSRSSVTLCLPRWKWRKCRLSEGLPRMRGGRLRSYEPPGGSMSSTSAPRSVRSFVQYAPGSPVRAMTRMSSSGGTR